MNDKLNNEVKENIKDTGSDEPKLEESVVEETVIEKTVVEAVEQKDEEKKSSSDNKKIKDYLSKDLFADIKRISFSDDQPSEDNEKSLSEIRSRLNDWS